MEYKRIKEFRTIAAQTAEEFSEKMNAVIADSGLGLDDIEIEHGRNDFRAYVIITKEVSIPENARDESKLDGICHKCEDCPHYELPRTKTGAVDRRAKSLCKYFGFRVEPGREACEERYESLKSGEEMPERY